MSLNRPATSSRHRPTADELQSQCDAFNASYPVGQPVNVLRDSGKVWTTRTRSRAEVLSGHTVVIWVEGIAGCYLLDRVAPVAEDVAA